MAWRRAVAGHCNLGRSRAVLLIGSPGTLTTAAVDEVERVVFHRLRILGQRQVRQPTKQAGSAIRNSIRASGAPIVVTRGQTRYGSPRHDGCPGCPGHRRTRGRGWPLRVRLDQFARGMVTPQISTFRGRDRVWSGAGRQVAQQFSIAGLTPSGSSRTRRADRDGGAVPACPDPTCSTSSRARPAATTRRYAVNLIVSVSPCSRPTCRACLIWMAAGLFHQRPHVVVAVAL